MRNIINIIIIIAVGIGIFKSFSNDSGEDSIVQQVKYAKLGSCPEKTVDEMAKGFMGSPSWSSGKSEDGNTFVNLEGDISFMEKKVSAVIQFIFNDDDTFKYNALEFNEIPQNNLIASSLLEKMCDATKE
ncbi:uncharacterized protein METZ01_LOCUS282773 [marine metagenome]|uniref:Uncharacterized protein n=1 Tax=marine metagenome TaxID=408172 RepID=A0A382L004_9ZZZZ